MADTKSGMFCPQKSRVVQESEAVAERRLAAAKHCAEQRETASTYQAVVTAMREASPRSPAAASLSVDVGTGSPSINTTYTFAPSPTMAPRSPLVPRSPMGPSPRLASSVSPRSPQDCLHRVQGVAPLMPGLNLPASIAMLHKLGSPDAGWCSGGRLRTVM